MLFNSYIFVFLFLPCALLGYFLLNNVKKYELAKCFLIGMSLWFYAYFEEMRETQFVIFSRHTVSFIGITIWQRVVLKRA